MKSTKKYYFETTLASYEEVIHSNKPVNTILYVWDKRSIDQIWIDMYIECAQNSTQDQLIIDGRRYYLHKSFCGLWNNEHTPDEFYTAIQINNKKINKYMSEQRAKRMSVNVGAPAGPINESESYY